MKKEKLQVNKMFYSERHNCYGMCVGVTSYMAFMLFVHSSHPNGWYHAAELMESHYG